MRDFFAASSVRSYSVAADKPSLDGTSSNYVEEMYNSWLRDPASVHTVSTWTRLNWKKNRSIVVPSIIMKHSLFLGAREIIFFFPVMGRIFPKQHLLCTTIICAATEKSCAIIIIGTNARWRCIGRRWTRRKNHWRSFGCASNH